MSRPGGEPYRARSLPERIAAMVPSAGPFGVIRRRLKPMFERFLAPADGELRSVLPGGEVVLVSPAFRHVTWNPEEYSAFRTAVRPGDVIVEAGANVGAYTILFGQWAGPRGRVFAFEPDPKAHDGLQRHVELNGLTGEVTVVPLAIMDDMRDSIRFAMFPSSGISRLASGDHESGATVRDVGAISIDRFCEAHGLTPSVIKIDVEGAELAALRGARQTIARAGSRLGLFVEMHPQLWPHLGISAEDLRKECEAQGLRAEKLDGGTEKLWETEGVCLRLRAGREP